jgi:O-acetylhomoserine (thiol)-lyase
MVGRPCAFQAVTPPSTSWRRDDAIKAVAVPIYQTESCQLDNTGQAARPFALRDWAISTLVSATTTSDVLECALQH